MRNDVDKCRFGKNLKRLMKERKMSQLDLSLEIDADITAISNWCRGYNLPQLMVFPEIAKALGVTMEELWYGKE